MHRTGTITAAAGQLRARPLEQADDALDAIIQAVRQAGRLGVDLLVLPECAYPAYNLRSRTTYEATSLLGYDALIQLLCDNARASGLHLVVGLVEPHADQLHNAAVLIGPDGQVIGTYRKQFLWDNDHDYFTPGKAIDVFETALGRIGILICADARAPEVVATLTAERAELVALPTNWVNATHLPGEFYNPQPDFLIPARCREFGLPFICANKSGQEDAETRFCGLSRVVVPDGTTAAETGPTGEAIVVAELAPNAAPAPQMPADCRRRLVSSRPPTEPPVGECLVTLAVARSDDDRARLTPQRRCIAMTGRPTDPTSFQVHRRELTVVEPPSAPGLRSAGGNTIGCACGADADGFGWPRTLALRGASVLCLFQTRADLDLLRTRAIENRVFVAALTEEWGAVIAPDGAVLARDHRLAMADVDLADAADKTVTPRTHVFAERRPRSYRF